MDKEFRIFTGGPDTRFNACVGDNGCTDTITYYEGYFLSAKFLTDKVIDDWPQLSPDVAIYPILFNLRHGIELALKKNLMELLKIKKFRSALKVNTSDLTKHELAPLWQTTKECAEYLDERYTPIIQVIDNLITEIANVDPSGQTFRYPYDLGTQSKHLKGITLINIERVRTAAEEIKKQLEKLVELSIGILNEYGLGTYTSSLSRRDIHKISKLLMQRADWVKCEFDTNKDEIKLQFGIGSKKLSNALKIIENHYEFCPNIGLEKAVEGLNSDELGHFLRAWKKATERTDAPLGIEFVGAAPKPHNIDLPSISNQLSEEACRWLKAIYYMGRDNGHCEQLDRFLKLYTRSKKEELYHLLTKTNFDVCFRAGLMKLGQTTLLTSFDKLIGKQ